MKGTFDLSPGSSTTADNTLCGAFPVAPWLGAGQPGLWQSCAASVLEKALLRGAPHFPQLAGKPSVPSCPRQCHTTALCGHELVPGWVGKSLRIRNVMKMAVPSQRQRNRLSVSPGLNLSKPIVNIGVSASPDRVPHGVRASVQGECRADPHCSQPPSCPMLLAAKPGTVGLRGLAGRGSPALCLRTPSRNSPLCRPRWSSFAVLFWCRWQGGADSFILQVWAFPTPPPGSPP